MPSDRDIDRALHEIARESDACRILGGAKVFFEGILATVGWWRPARLTSMAAIRLLERGLRRRGCEDGPAVLYDATVPAPALLRLLSGWQGARQALYTSQERAAARECAADLVAVLRAHGVQAPLELLRDQRDTEPGGTP